MGNASNKPLDYSLRIPNDERDERFVKSFNLNDDPNEILAFYQHYGLVVFDNILNEDELEESIDDLWSFFPGINRNDPTTWGKNALSHPFSFVGEEPLGGQQIWKNRQHQNIYAAFKLLYELTSRQPLVQPLIACLDRGSIMRPTLPPHGQADWKCERLPHFDLNPWVYLGKQKADPLFAFDYERYHRLLAEGNNTAYDGKYPKLRAVLQISESTADKGGLECFVGFNNQIENYCKLNKLQSQKMNPYGWGVAYNDPIAQNMQKITVRKGSLIIFSAELPHSMFPNESLEFRYAQYLRMTPLSTLQLSKPLYQQRRALLKKYIPTELILSEIGQEVFMMQEEKDDELTAKYCR